MGRGVGTYGPYADPEGTLRPVGASITRHGMLADSYPHTIVHMTLPGTEITMGPYGHCWSPCFRDQGRTADGSPYFTIQYGEPNPEVYKGSWPGWWPYWYWDRYVFWWHLTY